MALEVGTHIEDLVDTNPPTTDKRHEGDDHLRLIKTCAKNSCPVDFRNISASETENSLLVVPVSVPSLHIVARKFRTSFMVGVENILYTAPSGNITWAIPGTNAEGTVKAFADTDTYDQLSLYTFNNETRLTIGSGVSAVQISFQMIASVFGENILSDWADFNVKVSKNGSLVATSGYPLDTLLYGNIRADFLIAALSEDDYLEIEIEQNNAVDLSSLTDGYILRPNIYVREIY